MIEIILPVYNGEKYLRQQIESILNQSNQEWILKIRNDGSTDSSRLIIEEYCRNYPEKIVEITNPKSNIGLVQSINLLVNTEPICEYIMFCDQDDIWLPYKIDISLDAIKEEEAKLPSKPVMICTDASCIDEDGNIIEKSFFISQKFNMGVVGDKYKMIVENQVQGCTVIINRIAVNYIFPIPNFLKIHDMWIGVICAHYGVSKYLNNQTMLYRQHSNNVLGSIKVDYKYVIKRSTKLFDLIHRRKKLFKVLPFKVNWIEWAYLKIKLMATRVMQN